MYPWIVSLGSYNKRVKIEYIGTTIIFWSKLNYYLSKYTYRCQHGLRTPREEIAFTARPKTHSHSQMFRYDRSIFCLPHRPNFSDIFDLCLHWVSVVRGFKAWSKIENMHGSFWNGFWNMIMLHKQENLLYLCIFGK